jgi:hypothetical protein
MIEKGQYKFFERGAVKIPLAKKPTEDSLLYLDERDSKN